MRLSEIIPNHTDLLAMEPEEVAGVLIEFVTRDAFIQSRKPLHPSEVFGDSALAGYEQRFRDECERACAEGWAVLLQEGVLVPVPNQNHGLCFISRRGKAIKTRTDFSVFRKARLFSREALHPLLQTEAYNLFLRGQHETAVFSAFKMVEVKVREACPPEMASLLGVQLVTKAFNPSGGPFA